MFDFSVDFVFKVIYSSFNWKISFQTHIGFEISTNSTKGENQKQLKLFSPALVADFDCDELFSCPKHAESLSKLSLFSFLNAVALTENNLVNFKWNYQDKNSVGRGM